MEAHMRHRLSGGTGNTMQCAELVDHHRGEFGRVDLHGPPAEALQVRKAYVRADLHPTRKRRAHGTVHDRRVTSMETTGDIGRGDHIKQCRIVTDPPVAIALRDVRVQIDPHGAEIPGKV